jgi:hypothetical protein
MTDHLVLVDHINRKAIDHLAGVITDHPASIHVARSEKINHPWLVPVGW